MLKNKVKLNFFSLLTITSLFFLRPMFLGYVYTSIGLTILLISACTSRIFKGGLLVDNKYSIYVTNIAVKSYFPVLVLVFLTQKIDLFLGDLGIFVITIFSLNAIFSFKDITYSLFYVLKVFFLFIIISTIITSVYYYTSKYLEIDSLEVYKFKLRSRGETGSTIKIYFPFSSLYGYMTTPSIRLLKFNLYFMESGMVPGFFSAISFIILQKKNTLSLLLYFLFLLGSILSVSTALVPCFILPFVVHYLFSIKKINILRLIGIILFLFVGFYVFYKTPFFGYEAKNVTHGSSFQDRINWFSLSIENLTRYTRTASALFLIYIVGKKHKNKALFYSYMSPIFFTGIVNFVLYSPLFLFFLFFDFSKNKKMYKGII